MQLAIEQRRRVLRALARMWHLDADVPDDGTLAQLANCGIRAIERAARLVAWSHYRQREGFTPVAAAPARTFGAYNPGDADLSAEREGESIEQFDAQRAEHAEFYRFCLDKVCASRFTSRRTGNGKRVAADLHYQRQARAEHKSLEAEIADDRRAGLPTDPDKLARLRHLQEFRHSRYNRVKAVTAWCAVVDTFRAGRIPQTPKNAAYVETRADRRRQERQRQRRLLYRYAGFLVIRARDTSDPAASARYAAAAQSAERFARKYDNGQAPDVELTEQLAKVLSEARYALA